MMSPSPGAEQSFNSFNSSQLSVGIHFKEPSGEESVGLIAASRENNNSLINSETVVSQNTNNDVVSSSDRKSSNEFNFSSLWRKPRITGRRMIIGGSSESRNSHIKLESPREATIEQEPEEAVIDSSDTNLSNIDTHHHHKNHPLVRKLNKRRHVKDRESFDTMASVHLSDFDESKDVIPILMERDGWEIQREEDPKEDVVKDDDNCNSAKKDHSSKGSHNAMFLTPTPTKSKERNSDFRWTFNDNNDPDMLVEESDDDGIFTHIRSSGFKKDIRHSSKKSGQFIKSHDNDEERQQSLERQDLPEERDEVHDIPKEPVLSSISEDSGDVVSYQGIADDKKSTTNQMNEPSGKATDETILQDMNKSTEKESSTVETSVTSFSDRLTFYQSKSVSQQQQQQPFKSRTIPPHIDKEMFNMEESKKNITRKQSIDQKSPVTITDSVGIDCTKTDKQEYHPKSVDGRESLSDSKVGLKEERVSTLPEEKQNSIPIENPKRKSIDSVNNTIENTVQDRASRFGVTLGRRSSSVRDLIKKNESSKSKEKEDFNTKKEINKNPASLTKQSTATASTKRPGSSWIRQTETQTESFDTNGEVDSNVTSEPTSTQRVSKPLLPGEKPSVAKVVSNDLFNKKDSLPRKVPSISVDCVGAASKPEKVTLSGFNFKNNGIFKTERGASKEAIDEKVTSIDSSKEETVKKIESTSLSVSERKRLFEARKVENHAVKKFQNNQIKSDEHASCGNSAEEERTRASLPSMPKVVCHDQDRNASSDVKEKRQTLLSQRNKPTDMTNDVLKDISPDDGDDDDDSTVVGDRRLTLKSVSREAKTFKDSSPCYEMHDKEDRENGKQVESYRESLCTARRRLFEKGSMNVSRGPFVKSNCLSNPTTKAEAGQKCYNSNSARRLPC